jgi:hypothetical protein
VLNAKDYLAGIALIAAVFIAGMAMDYRRANLAAEAAMRMEANDLVQKAREHAKEATSQAGHADASRMSPNVGIDPIPVSVPSTVKSTAAAPTAATTPAASSATVERPVAKATGPVYLPWADLGGPQILRPGNPTQEVVLRFDGNREAVEAVVRMVPSMADDRVGTWAEQWPDGSIDVHLVCDCEQRSLLVGVANHISQLPWAYGGKRVKMHFLRAMTAGVPDETVDYDTWAFANRREPKQCPEYQRHPWGPESRRETSRSSSATSSGSLRLPPSPGKR